MNRLLKTTVALLAGGLITILSSSCAGPTTVGNYGPNSLSGPSMRTRGPASNTSAGYTGGGTTTSQIMGRQRALGR